MPRLYRENGVPAFGNPKRAFRSPGEEEKNAFRRESPSGGVPGQAQAASLFGPVI